MRFMRLSALILCLAVAASAQGKGKGHGHGHNADDDSSQADNANVYSVFTRAQRDHINQCFANGKSGLPPGLAKKDRLPPGLERQLRRNGKLPPGLQKKVQPLGADCQVGLPKLPTDWRRVVLGDRVILVDPTQRIRDWFRVVMAGPYGNTR